MAKQKSKSTKNPRSTDSPAQGGAVGATSRARIWPVAAASGVVLSGQVLTTYGLASGIANGLVTINLSDEQIAMLVAGCIGSVAAFVGMAIERFKPELMDNPAAKGTLGVSVLLSGLVATLTVLFGKKPESVMLIVSALGLTGAGTLVTSELQQLDPVKARAAGASEKANHGPWGIGLVLSCLLNLTVASVNYSDSTAGLGSALGAAVGPLADMQLTSVIFSVPMLIGSGVGEMIGGSLGDKEKYAYLGLTLTLVLSAALFPPVASAKGVSMPAAILSALCCSGMITKNLFNREA
jgi:hypothetical protein